MKSVLRLCVVLLPFCLPAWSTAAEKPPIPKPENQLEGIKYGIGVSLSYDVIGEDRVVTATLDQNGIVRVSDEQNFPGRIVLESHYFFRADSGKWGHGPFVAVQPGSEKMIEAVGGGWMVGFLQNPNSSQSWNIGVGVLVSPSVRVLGDDIEPNETLPTGETTIRYKNVSQVGGMGMISFTFN